MMLASLADIGSPEASLLAVVDQCIIDNGDVCWVVLLGGKKFLTESMLPVLFFVSDVGRRELRLLKQQNR